MKILKILILGLVCLLLLVLLAGFLMPSHWKAERSLAIRATPAAVHAHVGNLERWPEWMPWIAEDPQMAIEFEGEAGAVGSVMRWKSVKMGDGTMTLTHTDPPTGMGYSLRMREFDTPAHGTIRLAPEGDNTRVTWTDEGEVGRNPIMRVSVPLLEAMLGHYFDLGLGALKKNVESGR